MSNAGQRVVQQLLSDADERQDFFVVYLAAAAGEGFGQASDGLLMMGAAAPVMLDEGYFIWR